MTELNTGTQVARSSGKAVDINRKASETRVDRTKLAEIAKAAGLVPSDVRNFRLALTTELMVTKAIREAAMCYLTHPQLIGKHKGRAPTLNDLLNEENPLLISVWRREKGKRVLKNVRAHTEIRQRMADLYKEVAIKTGGAFTKLDDPAAEAAAVAAGAPHYHFCVPLLNAHVNPARKALEEAILCCNDGVTGSKAIRGVVKFIGVDVEAVEVDDESKIPEASPSEASAS